MRQNPHVRICGGPGSATTLVYPTNFRYAVDPARPWLGRSPLQFASDTGRLGAALEARLGDEAGGYALPVNASCPGSPQAHASLGSGWRPDGVGYLYGFKQGSKITSWHLVLLDRASPGTRVVARIEIEPPRSQLTVVHRPAA